MLSIQCTSEKRLPQTHFVWFELEGVTVTRWKAHCTFNSIFTDVSTILLTKRGVTSRSEKMLFSAHGTLKKSNHNFFKVII